MAGLERPLPPMPENVRAALKKRGLTEAYEARPDYQRNDYLGWIAQRRLREHGLARLRRWHSDCLRDGQRWLYPWFAA
jgi:hypothetical protein